MSLDQTSRQPLRVLLVEDSALQTLLFTKAFERVSDLEIWHTAHDGEMAIHFLNQCAVDKTMPDLVILDLHMPKKNGFEVLQALRANKDVSGLPVIMMTTSDDPQDVVRAYRCGADQFITKPTVLSELVQSLTSIAAGWRHLGKASA